MIVKHVTDAEMAVLFGHEVIALGKPTTFGAVQLTSSWVDSKGLVAWTIAKTLTNREAKTRQKTGAPDQYAVPSSTCPPGP